MFGCPLYTWTPPYVQMLPMCLNDVWMPPVHTQHKESMLCQTKGVSVYPHTFGCPLFIWIPLVCLDATICLDAPPVCLHTPICLDGPLCVWMPPYIWTPPHVWMPTFMFGHCHVGTSLYGWMPPQVWTSPCMFGCPPYVWLPHCMFGCCQMYGGIQRYEGHSNIWEVSKHTGAPSKHIGASKCMGAYGHPLNLTQHAFFVLYMYSRHVQTSFKHTWGHPNMWEYPHIFRGHPNIGVPKHTRKYPNIWGIQTYRGCIQINGGIQTYWGCPNIWGHPTILEGVQTWGASKHTGAIQTYGASKHTGGIQTYGGIQMYGAYGHLLSLTKHAFFVLYMYIRHPNIFPNIHGGIQTYGNIHTYAGGIQT